MIFVLSLEIDPVLYSPQQIFNTAIMQELKPQSDEKYPLQ
jgi:hypothetical protein